MSKTKENPEIDFRLVRIEQTGFSLEVPEGFKLTGELEYTILLESVVNAEKQRLVVTNRVEMYAGDKMAGHLNANYYFELNGFEHIKKNKKGTHIIPPAIQLAINSVALSTTRGLLFAQFRGTALHNAILPLIDPAAFSLNQVEE